MPLVLERSGLEEQGTPQSGKKAGLSETTWPGRARARTRAWCVVVMETEKTVGREPFEAGKGGGGDRRRLFRCGRKDGPLRRE